MLSKQGQYWLKWQNLPKNKPSRECRLGFLGMDALLLLEA